MKTIQTAAEQSVAKMSQHDLHTTALLPIGVFDSGVGGFTVVRALTEHLPHESIYYFGDTARCPYGPRELDEIKQFALQISSWLVKKKVKLIVIACNSASVAGLEAVQRALSVPVIGVIEPGARTAVQTTVSRRVGIIGTRATVESGAYTRAIRALDAGIKVFSAATPTFVEIVEQGLRFDHTETAATGTQVTEIYIQPEYEETAREYLEPLKRCKLDTLVLGCTHFPLLSSLISAVMGPEVQIISSAEETAREVATLLKRRDQLAPKTSTPKHHFATTAHEVHEFSSLGSAILRQEITADTVVSVPLEELERERLG